MPGRRCFFCFFMLVMTICTFLVNFEQSFLIKLDSLVATVGSDNLTESIMISIVNISNDSDNETETSDACKCQTEMNRTVYPCQSSQISANSTIVIHCNSGSHGMFMIRLNTSNPSAHIGAFVRVNGPLIDTIFFTWNDSESAWIARYNSCLQGSYSSAVYIYMHSIPDAEAVLRSEACLHQLFYAPFLFSWLEHAPSAQNCPSLWRWAERKPEDVAGELSLFSPCPPREDYVEAFGALQTLIPAIDWAAQEQQRRANKSTLICLFGDSQIRNLMNSITAQIDPQACDPVELQLGRASCNYPGFYYGNFHFFLYDNDWTTQHESRLGDCSHAFINYGQWPGSWGAKTPWPRSKYRESIIQFSKRLSELKLIFPDVQFYFLSTNYHSFSPGMKTCPATDFRFPHIIDSYNDEAREIFTADNTVGFIDTTRVIRPLFDLSFDCAHYQGAVGVALANLVGNCFYNNVC